MKLYNFEEFLNEMKFNEEHEMLLTEAFNSSIIQNMTANKKGGLGKTFYDALSKMGIAASTLTNADLTPVTPQDAEKLTKQDPNLILIYYSSKEKKNPYTNDSWYSKVDGDCVLAVVKGKLYMALKYDRYASKGGKAEYNLVPAIDKNAGQALGGVEKTGGKYGSGLTSLKRMADVTDVVYVINPSELEVDSKKMRTERAEAKKGAAAFKDDKQFKAENMSRYEAILRERASNDDIDSIVRDSIDKITDQIKAALTSGKKGSYGDILVGEDPKGREVRMSDATRLMEKMLDNYARYTQYIDTAQKSEERHGLEDSYYKREAASKAKDIKDAAKKIENFNYAW
jgi:hypothetical protein